MARQNQADKKVKQLEALLRMGSGGEGSEMDLSPQEKPLEDHPQAAGKR
jgi:hypothetical protein